MKSFRQMLLSIAIPVTIQSLMRSSLNFIDTIMVGSLGDVAIASVGIANQLYFLMNIFLLGITSGLAIFVSQFLGKQDSINIKKATGLALSTTLVFTGIFALFAYSFNRFSIKMFTNDIEVIELGSQYIRIAAISYVITGLTAVFSTVTRSTGKAIIPLITSFVGVGLNTILNYLLIFGVGVFPQLGVRGAAIATVISRSVEVIILLVLVYSKHPQAAVKLHDLHNFSKGFVRKFYSESSVIVIKDIIWGVGVTAYVAIYARISTESIAAINILNTIKAFAFVFLQGIAAAGLVMVGNQIGAGREDEAFDFAKKLQKLGIVLSICIAGLVIIIRPIVLIPFDISQTVYQYTYILLLIFACYFPIESYNMISVMSILRSGADNKFCLYMDLIAVWAIGLLLAFVSAVLLKQSIVIVFALVTSQEIFKAYVLRRRVNSKKWINNVVDDL